MSGAQATDVGRIKGFFLASGTCFVICILAAIVQFWWICAGSVIAGALLAYLGADKGRISYRESLSPAERRQLRGSVEEQEIAEREKQARIREEEAWEREIDPPREI